MRGGRTKPGFIVGMFLLAPVLLVAQVLVTDRFDEPYPGLALPAFGAASPVSDSASTTEPVFVLELRGRRPVEVDHTAFVGRTTVAPLFIVRLGFSEGFDRDGHPIGVAPRRRWSPQGFLHGPPPGRTWAGSIRATEPETVEWLRRRSRPFVAGAEVEAVVVRWDRRTYSVPDGALRSTEVVQQVRIQLDTES